MINSDRKAEPTHDSSGSILHGNGYQDYQDYQDYQGAKRKCSISYDMFLRFWFWKWSECYWFSRRKWK